MALFALSKIQISEFSELMTKIIIRLLLYIINKYKNRDYYYRNKKKN